MDIRFNGKVAIVTGGSRGLGFVCARRLAESGARVAILAKNPAPLAEAETKLGAFGTVKAYQLDLSVAGDIPGTVKKIRAEMGEIDVLVNCAALLFGGDALELTEADWDRIMAVNVKALFFMMQAVVKQSMMPRKSGSIVNISSMAGVRGMAIPLCSAVYSASKGAVGSLTQQAATEWGRHNIRVNAIAPGGISPDEPVPGMEKRKPPFAEMAPLGHGCTQSEVAATVCYLAGDVCNSITGTVTILDGGCHVLGF